jgi:hypothetical protein
MALRKFACAGIPVIRLGLQTTQELEEPGAVIAGPYHPAFRTLVESAIFLEMAEALLESAFLPGTEATFFVSPGDLSNLLGLRRENLAALKKRCGTEKIMVTPDAALERGRLVIQQGEKRAVTDFSGRISRI